MQRRKCVSSTSSICHFKFHVFIICFHLISTFLIIHRSIPILLSLLAYTLVFSCVQFTFVVAVCQFLVQSHAIAYKLKE